MTTAKRMTFRRCERLKKYSDIQKVFKNGLRLRNDLLQMHVMQNFLDCSRLAALTSKALGNAVARNRWRRLVRESFRLNKSSFKWNVDIVVKPLVPPARIKQGEVERRFLDLVAKFMR